MTICTSREFHQWNDPTYVKSWIENDLTRDAERLPRLRMLSSLIPFERHDVIRVLDVGAGYGLLTQVICETFPDAQVICHDFSEAMFNYARQRLKEYAQRVRYVKSDLSSPVWTNELQSSFHAVVSAIAIHNIRIPGRIPSIYREIFKLVEKGGCFLNAELMAPPGPISARFYQRERLLARQRQLKEKGIEKSLEDLIEESHAEALARGVSPNEMGMRFPNLESQLRWLQEAGFNEVDVFWKEGGQAIIGGYRLPG